MNKNFPLQLIGHHPILKRALKYVMSNNKGNGNPYHNLNHLLQFTKYAFNISRNEHTLSDYDEIKLLLASLFHDFNYDVKVQPDANRILMAKTGLLDFIRTNNIGIDVSEIYPLLDATEYPYVIPVDELTYMQRVMRDADLMQVFEPNFVHQIIYGLSAEYGISIPEMITLERKFLNSVTFNTNYGRQIREMYWHYVIEEFDILDEIYKED